jgi:sugar phosphate isomerase/epimerase
MKIDRLPGEVHLTYCTNIHAGESWPEVRASLDAHVPAIKAAITPDRPLGIGLRLSGQAAAAARAPEALAAFRDQLARLGAYVFTINAFPFGPFHGVRVKQDVYLPDWRSDERVVFTADAAAVLAAVLPDGVDGSISTVPGAFKPNARADDAHAAMTHRLLRAAADLVAIERHTGKRIALALEPEPCCFIETVDESIAFFETALFAPDAVQTFGRMTQTGAGEAATLLRRHLGVCYDVCHGSVEYEDPVAALDQLIAAGIAIPKIQLSAAMRVPVMTPDLVGAVMRYDDGVYLHQTIVRRGRGLTRYVDLPDAVAALDGGAAPEWRIHCHVPVFLENLGALQSTRTDLLATLAALRRRHRSSHLEVETYTWDVLPADLRTGSKAADIAREIAFCAKELAA